MPKSQLDWLGIASLWIGVVIAAIKAGGLPLMNGAPSFFAAQWWNYLPVVLVSIYILIALYRLRSPNRSITTYAPVAQPVPKQDQPAQPTFPDALGRTFLASNVTVKVLMDMCENKTSVQVNRIVKGYLGKWLRYSGDVSNVHLHSATTVVSMRIQTMCYVTVEIAGADIADVLHVGDEITVIGKIKSINTFSVELAEGEIEAR